MLLQRLPLILMVLVIFLISLVVTMPIYQAYKWGVFPDNIALQGLQGRLVKGSAREVQINDLTLNNVTWSWQPSLLLTGRLSVNWQINDSDVQGKGIASVSLFANKQISATTLSLNLNKINAYLPKKSTLAGKVDLDLALATFSEQLETINATAKVGSLLLTSVLGHIETDKINMIANGSDKEGFQLRITDSQNSDNMTILAEMKQQQLSLSGLIKDQFSLAQQVSSLLPLIAKKQGNNWVVSWQGVLPKM